MLELSKNIIISKLQMDSDVIRVAFNIAIERAADHVLNNTRCSHHGCVLISWVKTGDSTENCDMPIILASSTNTSEYHAEINTLSALSMEKNGYCLKGVNENTSFTHTRHHYQEGDTPPS